MLHYTHVVKYFGSIFFGMLKSWWSRLYMYIYIYVVFVQVVENTKELKKKLKDNIRRKSDLFKNGDLGTDKV